MNTARHYPPPSVDEGKADSYTIRNEGEWSKIFIEQGQRPDGTRWGYISFVSTFGNRGHVFSSIGAQSFEAFLLECGWDYLANKFWGLESRVFDFDESVKAIKMRVIERRRCGSIDADHARECWDDIEALEFGTSEGFFCGQIYFDCAALMKHADMYDDSPVIKVDNPQCEGFRDHIWRPFCDHLRAQLAKVAA